MKLKELVTNEEYDSLITSPLSRQKYPIFVDPDRSEIRELAEESNLVRFIAYQGRLYVFSAALLHAFVIKHLELPLSSNPSIDDAFLGIAKANLNGTLAYYDSNQKIPNAAVIAKKYSFLSKWFS